MNTDIANLSKTPTDVSIFDESQMMMATKYAEEMAKNPVLPAHFKGNVENCRAVIMQSIRWGMHPDIVAAKTHIVNGNLGYEAQLVNAVITSSTAIEGRFHYEYSDGPWIVQSSNKSSGANGGDKWVTNNVNESDMMRCGAKLKGEDEIQWGEWLYPAAVKVRNSPLWWQSGAGVKQQCAYLALKYWARMYAPQVIMGVYTSDELDERELKVVNPSVAGGVLDLSDEEPLISGEIVDSVAADGSIDQVDTTTGEVIDEDEIYTSVKAAIEAATTPAELMDATRAAEPMNQEGSPFQELRTLYGSRKAEMMAQAEEAANAATANQGQ